MAFHSHSPKFSDILTRASSSIYALSTVSDDRPVRSSEGDQLPPRHLSASPNIHEAHCAEARELLSAIGDTFFDDEDMATAREEANALPSKDWPEQPKAFSSEKYHALLDVNCEKKVLLLSDTNAVFDPNSSAKLTLISWETASRIRRGRESRGDVLAVPFFYKYRWQEKQSSQHTVAQLVRSFIRQTIDMLAIDKANLKVINEFMRAKDPGRFDNMALTSTCPLLECLLRNLPEDRCIIFIIDSIHFYEKEDKDAPKEENDPVDAPRLPEAIEQLFQVFKNLYNDPSAGSGHSVRLFLTGEPIPAAVQNYFSNHNYLTVEEIEKLPDMEMEISSGEGEEQKSSSLPSSESEPWSDS